MDTFENITKNLMEKMSLACITDQTGIIIYCNERYRSISGYSADELLGLDIKTLTSPIHDRNYKKQIWDTVENNDIWKGELQQISKQGTPFWIDLKISLLNYEGKKILVFIGSDITLKKIFEDQIRFQGQKFKMALIGTNVGTWEWNVESGEVILNKEWLKLVGENSQSQLGTLEDIISRVHPQDIEKFKKDINKHINGHDKYFESSHRLKHFSGRWIYALTRGTIIENNPQTGRKVFATTTDITKNLKNELFLQRTQKAAKIGSWEYLISEKEFKWTEFNNEIFQMNRNQQINLNKIISFFIKIESNDISELFDEAIQHGKNFEGEFQIITNEMTVKWIKVICEVDRDDEEIQKLYGTFQDIDGRKRAEIELAHSEERLNLAAQSANIGIWDLDILSNTLIWDENMLSMYNIDNLNMEEGIGAWYRLICDEDREKFEDELHEAIIRGDRIESELRIKNNDGNFKYIKNIAKVFRDDNDKAYRVLGVNLDITKEKRQEKVIIKSREDAIKATELKSKFLANMSHEIRTPLNGIIGMVDLLFDTKLTEEQNKIVNTMIDCSEGLLAIVNDILDFSKLEAKKLELFEEDLKLRPYLENIMYMFQSMAQQKNIGLDLECHFDRDLEIHIDKGRLRQIVINILGNAIKFTEQGEVRLKVSLDTDINTLYFEIKDTGIGMTDIEISRIFDEFGQANSKVQKQFGGTGLGLSISVKLINIMGGSLQVTSEKNIGSVFSFTTKFKPAIGTPLSSPKIKTKDKKLDLSKYNILVCEDNSTNQILIHSLFQKMNNEIDIAHDGNEGLQMALNKDYDLILMDVHMPEMDGITATKKLLSARQNYKDKIIALTANVLDIEIKECLNAGMTDYIQKPIRMNKLRPLLSDYFDRFQRKKVS
ncbi:MAG: PAS domain-containing protein [Halobacteriovoraceae bacterium]|nr:PAS domain-containing protein [Halobacteriovoraceae bacterium]